MRAVFSNIKSLSLIGMMLISVLACKKSSNFSPQPTLAERPNYYFSPDSTIADTVKITDNFFPVGYNLVAYITINAPGKIKQIDLQTFGTFEKIKIETMNGDSVPLYKEPSWPNYSFKGPYDSETSQKYRVIIHRATTKTSLAFIVTDQNNLQTPIYFFYQPVSLDKSLSSISKLFSQEATVQDAGSSANLKSYYSMAQDNAFTLENAKATPSSIDFAYATAGGNGYLTTADSVSRFSQNTSENISGAKHVLFAQTTLDINTATSSDILASIPKTMTNSIPVATGQTYFFRNQAGNYGLIKITSLQAGSVSGKANVVVEYNYIVTKPIN